MSKPRLTEYQCRYAAKHGFTAGQVGANLGANISTKEFLEAMEFYGIPYKSKHRINHAEGRRPVEAATEIDHSLRSVRVPRVIKVGTTGRRGVVRK